MSEIFRSRIITLRLRQTTAALEDDEVLSVSQVPLARALAMAASGELEDAKSIAALYRAQAVLG